MSQLASFSESSRQSALQRFQLLRAHLGSAGRLLRLLVKPRSLIVDCS